MPGAGAQSIRAARLVGGFSANEGFLEMQGHDGKWGQVVGDVLDAHGAATVACRQLGLGGGALRYWLYDTPTEPMGYFNNLE